MHRNDKIFFDFQRKLFLHSKAAKNEHSEPEKGQNWIDKNKVWWKSKIEMNNFFWEVRKQKNFSNNFKNSVDFLKKLPWLISFCLQFKFILNFFSTDGTLSSTMWTIESLLTSSFRDKFFPKGSWVSSWGYNNNLQ